MVRKKQPDKTDNVIDAISRAKEEVTSLKEELESWHDGMEGTNLENTQKYCTLEDAISELDEIKTELDSFGYGDLPEDVDMVVWKPLPRKASRAARASYAAVILESAAIVLAEWEDKHPEPGEDDEKAGEQWDIHVGACKELAADLDAQAERLQGVEFPGMYG